MSAASSSSSGRPNARFPRGVLIGAGLLLAAVLAIVGMAGPEDTHPAGEPVKVRMLNFKDMADGGVAVVDATTGGTITELAPGTGGFIRAGMRGLARERRRTEQGPETPFRLARWPDGRLTLEDPATGRMIDLLAFGQTQVETFDNFLNAPEGGHQR
jgi:putative photosynthetic complex assembly protein